MTSPEQFAIAVTRLEKKYATGVLALKDINFEVRPGEIFALLGPNGAGKTTLISTICGIVRATAGAVHVFGRDHVVDYREARSCIGLVPQELTLNPFSKVLESVNFSRGLFGKKANPAFIENLLKQLLLWDKKDAQVRTLSGGMKRRVMIAKALAHEPDILFLDEPSSGVDVELRKSMWEQVRALKESGVTIILTTHYIEEAEAMADRIGVINQGQLILVDDKKSLMKKLGKKELVLDLSAPLLVIPDALKAFNLKLSGDGHQLIFTYDSEKDEQPVADLLKLLHEQNIMYKDLNTRQSSLEDIFLGLMEGV